MLRALLATGRGRAGFGILLAVLFCACAGPLLAPHSPSALVGSPGDSPGGSSLLGTDYLGRDVISRVLWGGWSVLSFALLATLAAFAVGVALGLVAGFTRSLLDPLIMRTVDVILAFPPLLFFLILATSMGSGITVLLTAVAVVQIPGVTRLVYSVTREASVRAYVEAAVVRGERTAAILRREIFPNIVPPLVANFGLSLTYSVLLVAAVNFFGLGLQPPAANWALMISENRTILSLNPWATIAPASLIVALTIAVNLVGDAVATVLGQSTQDVAEVAATVRHETLGDAA